MTDKELKRLKRRDLLEMLVIYGEEIDRLEKELKTVNEKLAEREIMIETSGSLAEAAVRLNRVFEAAQAAADQYVENIRRRAGEAESEPEPESEAEYEEAEELRDAE